MLTPINMSRFKRAMLKKLYYELFEFISKDFMGKADCRLVHQEGNMLSPPSGGNIIHTAFRGGHSLNTNIKAQTYKAKAQLGDVQLDLAEETGEFTG